MGGRLPPYQTCSPFRDYQLRFAQHFNDCAAAENAIKEKLKGLRGQGEWFNMHHDDIRAFLISLKEKTP